MGEMKSTQDILDAPDQVFPREGTTAQKLLFLLRYAVQAPSIRNTQPWVFQIKYDEVSLYADRLRALPAIDPHDREMTISCGTALLNLRVAVHYFGHTAVTRILPAETEPDLLAAVKLGPLSDPTEEDQCLFEAIPRRHTNRQPFEPRKVPEELIDLLRWVSNEEGAWLHVVYTGETKKRLAALVGEADKQQWSDRNFRRDVAAWMRPNHSADKDGIPGYGLGMGDLTSLAGPLVTRAFDQGPDRAVKDEQLAAEAPALLVLGTQEDTPRDWLATGLALERVLLHAAAKGLSASFLSQPIEIPEMRVQLAELVGAPGYPQIMVRIGYGGSVRPTPRREIDDMLFYFEGQL